MIEVHEKLYVGAESDEHQIRGQPGWFVIHACKEPYHRQALNYTGRAASKDHPEYLLARRDGCLILNLVDVDDVNFIRTEIIDAALNAIHDNIKQVRFWCIAIRGNRDHQLSHSFICGNTPKYFMALN